MSKSRLFSTFVCFVVLVLVSTTLVYPQAKKGDQEILVNGMFFGQTGDYSFLMITGIFNYGVFVTKNLQIGGGPSISYMDSGGSESDVKVNLNAFLRLYLLKEGSKTVFYLGGEAYLHDAFPSDEGSDLPLADRLYLKPLIGLKHYFAKRAAFDINVGYGFGLTEGMGGMISGTFGVSIIL